MEHLVCDFAAQKYPDKMSFPSTQTQKTTMRDVAPLSIVFVSMMTFNNLCLAEVNYFFSQKTFF